MLFLQAKWSFLNHEDSTTTSGKTLIQPVLPVRIVSSPLLVQKRNNLHQSENEISSQEPFQCLKAFSLRKTSYASEISSGISSPGLSS